MQVDIVSDTICPWCFIGKRRFQNALLQRSEIKIKIKWRPLQLNPEMPREGLKQDKILQGWQPRDRGQEIAYAEVLNAGKLEGIDFRLDGISRIPNTVQSHRLILFAQEKGLQDIVIDQLFKAYFESGKDIGEIKELLKIASRVGMDTNQVKNYFEVEKNYAQVWRDERAARQMGISAVPCFIFQRRYVVKGAQNANFFTSLLDQITSENRRSNYY